MNLIRPARCDVAGPLLIIRRYTRTGTKHFFTIGFYLGLYLNPYSFQSSKIRFYSVLFPDKCVTHERSSRSSIPATARYPTYIYLFQYVSYISLLSPNLLLCRYRRFLQASMTIMSITFNDYVLPGRNCRGQPHTAGWTPFEVPVHDKARAQAIGIQFTEFMITVEQEKTEDSTRLKMLDLWRIDCTVVLDGRWRGLSPYTPARHQYLHCSHVDVDCRLWEDFRTIRFIHSNLRNAVNLECIV